MTPKKVLIIDDEDGIRNMFRIILKRSGYDVLEANRAVEGLAILDREKIDVVMLDIMMPGMTGMECLGVITKKHPGLPVIMVTGVINVDSSMEANEKGAFDYLVKPAKKNELLDVIGRALDSGE